MAATESTGKGFSLEGRFFLADPTNPRFSHKFTARTAHYVPVNELITMR